MSHHKPCLRLVMASCYRRLGSAGFRLQAKAVTTLYVTVSKVKKKKAKKKTYLRFEMHRNTSQTYPTAPFASPGMPLLWLLLLVARKSHWWWRGGKRRLQINKINKIANETVIFPFMKTPPTLNFKL